MVTLRDGARVRLRPIAPDDKPLLAASFERLSEESRYRRFFTHKNQLSAAELDYFVDVDHKDREAIIAIEPSSGELLGVARYIRWGEDAEVAEVAVTVADDWQGRGLGRALTDRLTYRARRAGVCRFSAIVLCDNRAALGLLEGAGIIRRRSDAREVEVIVELPPKRGTGTRLARVLRAAAAGSVAPATTLASSPGDLGSGPRPPVGPVRPIRTIVVGVDGSDTGEQALAVALQLAAALSSSLHLVSAYRPLQGPFAAEAVLAEAKLIAQAKGIQAVTHARRDDPARALVAVVQEHDADLLIVGSRGTSSTPESLLSGVLKKVSHRAPCSVLIVRVGPQNGTQSGTNGGEGTG